MLLLLHADGAAPAESAAVMLWFFADRTVAVAKDGRATKGEKAVEGEGGKGPAGGGSTGLTRRAASEGERDRRITAS